MFNHSNFLVIEDKIDFQSKILLKSFIHNNQKYVPIRINNFPTKIIRNLKNDDYNLEIPYPIDIEQTKIKNNPPNININNKFFLNAGENLELLLTQADNDSKTWKIHKNLLNNIKFSQTELISIGTDVKWDNTIDSPFFQYVFWPDILPKEKIYNLDFKKTIVFKSIEQINFLYDDTNWNFLTKDKIFSRKPTIEKIYNHIFLVPVLKNNLFHQKSLYKVYYQSDTNNFWKNNFLLNNGKIKDSFKNSYTTNFIPNLTNKENKTFFDKKADFIGEIVINENSYYDYVNKKVVVGFDDKMQNNGQVIPYHFSGNAINELQIDINSAFKDLKFLLNKKIEQPWLEPNQGSVQLIVREIASKMETKKVFNLENWNDLKNHIKNKRSLSLRGLANFYEEI